MEIHLVADTNLFFECLTLETLPWGELEYDSVVVLLTKPVMDEIDKHKVGKTRTRERAIAINKKIRDMLITGVRDVEIRNANPKVFLRRAGNIVPDPQYGEVLDYSKVDERLVGLTSTLEMAADGYKVALFSNDLGPISSAMDLGISTIFIADHWRRPPSETDEQKEIRELKASLAVFNNSEPKIVIGKVVTADASGNLVVKTRRAKPLTDGEIEHFLERLREAHPLKHDFTVPEPKTTTDSRGVATTITYSRPTEEEINRYTNETYSAWITSCRQVLASLHDKRDDVVHFVTVCWPLKNDGHRPAEKVRIEFRAKGALKLRRRPREDEQTQPTGSVLERRLPAAPKPPPFVETVTHTTVELDKLPTRTGLRLSDLRNATLFGGDQFGAAAARDLLKFSATHRTSIEQLLHHSQMPRLIDSLARVETPTLATSSFRVPTYEPHDPEAFYYSWRRGDLVEVGAVTCDVWRHQRGEEMFEFEVWFAGKGAVSGAVECTVHAVNLAKPLTTRLIVSREEEFFDLLGMAEDLIESIE